MTGKMQFDIFIENRKGHLMDRIKNIALIGLGAVGINFAYELSKHVDKENLWIIADPARLRRYQQDGVYYNQEICDFNYVDPKTVPQPADIVIFTTKFMGLREAMVTADPVIGHETLLMSAVNGISSEVVLAERYTRDQIIYSVAQGMDATKIGNQVTCTQVGELCFGDAYQGAQQKAIQKVQEFFDRTSFPYTIKEDILHHQWGKFMLNVGLNQVVAIHHGTYATIQTEGRARAQMLEAMEEVRKLSDYEGIHLSEAEVLEWAALCDHLSPQGKPSMAQDVDAKRKSEVELFAHEVLRRAKEYHLACPMNTYLADEIQKIEDSYA